ncbi:MAG: (deoxy)nucleoside triphosphate pyrophosphohydrolase [Atopobiaceae bacterium]|nr:(deoxy)nucleoside triphosphate pyrophosphohydrolase [Atopobiaceae bacterium]
MKTYHVVAAIIKKGDKIFATQRGYGDYKDGWEFPGGKIEPGETPEQALVREITEELGMTIAIDRHVVSISYDYPEFHLEMGSYLCSIAEGTPRLLEHEAAKWLRASEIDSVNWLPADVLVVDALKEQGIA